MHRPNLFIIGAPKCGTTALAKWLSAHPQVFGSAVKEPHHFSEEFLQTPTLDNYELLFTDADPHLHRWVFEASVWYLYCDSAVPNILRYAPDARFIVMVRNPLEMAPSLHGQLRFTGHELVGNFADALALSDRRHCGQRVGVLKGTMAPQFLAYLHCCLLGRQVERLLERVARKRIHFVVFDDLEASPPRVFSEVQSFLTIDPITLESFERVNSAKVRKSFVLDALVVRSLAMKSKIGVPPLRLGMLSNLRRWNQTEVERPPLPATLRRQMAEAYAEDVNHLGELLGRDLDHWLDVA